MTIRADLHCHTTHSDGSLSPDALLQLARKNGLTALAITDHDTISSYNEALAKAETLQLLTGVELSTVLNGHQVHILGYAFQPNHPVMRQFCEICRERRILRNREMMARLQAHGMPLEDGDIMGVADYQTAYGRPHIARAMVAKGYVRDHVEAFRRFIGEGKPCYFPGEKFRVEEGIAAIHESGGKAVIAHPHLINHNEVVEALLKLPFDGLEVHYSQFSETKNQKWAKIALEKGWLATGGSDFHGQEVRPGLDLGASLCPVAIFQLLWDHFQRHF